MESKSPSAGSVKGVAKKKAGGPPGKFPGFELFESQRRLRGYLLKVFAEGKEYHDWDKHAFHRRTCWIRNRRGQRISYARSLSVRHIERVVASYRKVCTEFRWEEIRLGRSTRLRVSRVDPESPGVPVYEIRRRLVGYIGAAVANNGVAKVDQVFLGHFVRATALPAELVHLVWSRTRKMAGFRARWRGVNNGRKLVVSRELEGQSPTHFSPGPISTHCVSERIKPKTSGLTPRFDPEKSSAPLRVANEIPPASDAPTSAPSSARPGRPTPGRPSHDPPRWPVLIVCERPVDGRKLARLAALLAVTRMRTPHGENWRVQWIFKYARNLAYRALREGFDVAEICRAYGSGVRQSHEDSLDADKAVTVRDGFHREPLRVPSAAVAYAWRELLRDGRDREERWEAIFSRGPRTAPPIAPVEIRPRPAGPKPVADPPATSGPQEISARPRKSREELDAMLAAIAKRGKPGEQLRDGPALTQGEFIEWLRAEKKMTINQLAALPYKFRMSYLEMARAWKRGRSP